MLATIAHNNQVLHDQIAAAVTSFNRALQAGGAVSDYWDLGTRQGLAFIDQFVTRQASVIAYIDNFKLMMLTIIPAILLLLCFVGPGWTGPRGRWRRTRSWTDGNCPAQRTEWVRRSSAPRRDLLTALPGRRRIG